MLEIQHYIMLTQQQTTLQLDSSVYPTVRPKMIPEAADDSGYLTETLQQLTACLGTLME